MLSMTISRVIGYSQRRSSAVGLIVGEVCRQNPNDLLQNMKLSTSDLTKDVVARYQWVPK